MQAIKQRIVEDLRIIVKDLTGQDIIPNLEHPKDERHGDYSTNIAMAIFVKSKIKNQKSKIRTPMDLAMAIAEKLKVQPFDPFDKLRAGFAQGKSSKFKVIDKVEAVAPGFINLWISKEYLTTLMIYIIRVKDEYGTSERLKDKKIMVEFTDPNPFKEFHIGHLYSNIVGESLSRLLESQGAIVWRACYQGDVGLHVAKALYGILRLCHAEFISASEILKNKILKQVQDDNLGKRIKFLGQAYALGVKAYEEDESAKKEIEKINKKVYEETPEVIDIYKKGREWSLKYFDTIYKRLGTEFKRFYFESEAGKIGLEIVKKNIDKVFKESDGAVIFPGEKYSLHNRVFINSLGLPTYEAKDLGLAQTKYKDFPYNLSIIITAIEQSDYFKVVIKALSMINPQLAHKTKHISHGVVRLPMGKMSSRTGTIITGEWLLDEAKRRIQKSYPDMDEATAERVALGAVKYALLKSGIGRDIAFDFDESISLEGNSGPYLQYTYARTQSVLGKASIGVMPNLFRHLASRKTEILKQVQDDKKSMEPEEIALLRSLYRFPEVVGEAAEEFAPNIICNYLFDLAQKFNLFYQKVPIIKSFQNVIARDAPDGWSRGDPRLDRGLLLLRQAQDRNDTKEFRLALTQAVGKIIKNGLYLLGIQSPEWM